MTKKELIQELITLNSLYGEQEKDLLKLTVSTLEGMLAQEKRQKEMEKQFAEMSAMLAQIKAAQAATTNTVAPTPQPANKAESRRAAASSIPRERMVRVMSGTKGKLVHKSPTSGERWVFNDYGDEDDMPYGELLKLRNISRRALQENMLIVMESDVADALNLSQQYQDILLPRDIENIVLHLDKLTAYFKKADKVKRELLLGFARDLYHEGRLTDIRIVKFLEEHFDIKFDELLHDKI